MLLIIIIIMYMIHVMSNSADLSTNKTRQLTTHSFVDQYFEFFYILHFILWGYACVIVACNYPLSAYMNCNSSLWLKIVIHLILRMQSIIM